MTSWERYRLHKMLYKISNLIIAGRLEEAGYLSMEYRQLAVGFLSHP